MITTAHFIIGGAVGVATGNPVAALVAGTVSHFVADMIPHLDVPPSAARDGTDKLIMTPQIWRQVWIDGVVGLAVVGWLWTSNYGFPALTPFVWGAFGGFLPDLIDNVPFWNERFRTTRFGQRFHRAHEWTHSVWDHPFPMEKYWFLGIATQVIAVGFALLYLL